MEFEDEEFLSEEQLHEILNTKYVSDFFVYFDADNGNIQAISNEKLPQFETFVESEFFQVERFFTKDNHWDYRVIIDDEGNFEFVHKSQGHLVFKSNIIEHIRLSDRDDVLTVQWTADGWNFILNEKFLSNPRAKSLNSRLPFYVAREHNINMLVRKIEIQLRILVNNRNVLIPFETEEEKTPSKVSMFALPFFESYGMKIKND